MPLLESLRGSRARQIQGWLGPGLEDEWRQRDRRTSQQ